MSLLKSLSVIALLCAWSDFTSGALPSYVNVCKRNKATINECILDNIKTLMPRLANGIPELNVPSIEPFLIHEVIPVHGDLAVLNASGKDFKVSGASSVVIKSFDIDFDTLTMHIKLRFPKLRVEGTYSLDTQILVVPLKGAGALVADVVKCDADVVIKCQLEKRNDIEYLKLTDMDLSLNIKDYVIRLDGLWNGDKALGDATNDVINQNKADVLKAIQPYIEKTVAKILLDTANKITETTPYSELLPL